MKLLAQLPAMDKLIAELKDATQVTLGDKLHGLYLFGSLVTGDFDPKTSDIDLLAIVETDVTETELEQLKGMHQAFVRDHPEWNDRIEVAYVGVEAMKNFKTKTASIARISPGEPLHYRDMDVQWLLDWYVVQEQGLILFGPTPKTFIPHIDRQEFVDMLKDSLPTWRDRVKEAKWKGYQSYIVLSVCRSLYAVRFGTQASKVQAAEWVAEEYPEWSSLMKQALTWRGLAGKADSLETQAETARFVEFGLDKAKTILSGVKYE